MHALLLALLGGFSSPARAADAGSLVFTELHVAPRETRCEWIELANVSGTTQRLDTCWLVYERVDGTETTRYAAALDGLSIDPARDASTPFVMAKQSESCHFYGASTVDCVAWDEAGTCLYAPDAVYDENYLWMSNSEEFTLCISCGPTEEALLDCAGTGDNTIVDSVRFDWDDDFDLTPCRDVEGGCSMQLAPDVANTDDNDIAGNWCAAPPPSGTAYFDAEQTTDTETDITTTTHEPVLFSPGEPSVCEPLPETCQPGDLVISEVMARPQASYDSWLEIRATSALAERCTLEGCLIEEQDPESLQSAAFGAGALLSPDSPFLVYAQSGNDFIDQGETVPAISGPGSSGLHIGSSDGPSTLSITCGDTVLDSVTVDEDWVEQRCPDRGCSTQLRPGLDSPDDNDTEDAWCLAPKEDETTLLSSKSTDEAVAFIYGTPGKDTVCAEYAWPEPGELAITEILADGAGDMTDWFELHNTSDRTLELQWCELVQLDAAEDDATGEGEFTERYRFFLGDDSHLFSIEPGAYTVFSKSECLDGSSGVGIDTAESDDRGTACTDGGYLFGSLFLKSDTASRLELHCEGELIDAASYNFDVMNIEEGHSIELKPGLVEGEPATANDDWQSWCMAAFTGDSFLDPAGEEKNYGTPGGPNDCVDTPVVKEKGVGCLCSSTGAPTPWAIGLLVGLGGLVLRRRR